MIFLDLRKFTKVSRPSVPRSILKVLAEGVHRSVPSTVETGLSFQLCTTPKVLRSSSHCVPVLRRGVRKYPRTWYEVLVVGGVFFLSSDYGTETRSTTTIATASFLSSVGSRNHWCEQSFFSSVFLSPVRV